MKLKKWRIISLYVYVMFTRKISWSITLSCSSRNLHAWSINLFSHKSTLPRLIPPPSTLGQTPHKSTHYTEYGPLYVLYATQPDHSLTGWNLICDVLQYWHVSLQKCRVVNTHKVRLAYSWNSFLPIFKKMRDKFSNCMHHLEESLQVIIGSTKFLKIDRETVFFFTTTKMLPPDASLDANIFTTVNPPNGSNEIHTDKQYIQFIIYKMLAMIIRFYNFVVVIVNKRPNWA